MSRVHLPRDRSASPPFFALLRLRFGICLYPSRKLLAPFFRFLVDSSPPWLSFPRDDLHSSRLWSRLTVGVAPFAPLATYLFFFWSWGSFFCPFCRNPLARPPSFPFLYCLLSCLVRLYSSSRFSSFLVLLFFFWVCSSGCSYVLSFAGHHDASTLCFTFLLPFAVWFCLSYGPRCPVKVQRAQRSGLPLFPSFVHRLFFLSFPPLCSSILSLLFPWHEPETSTLLLLPTSR